MPQTLSKIKSYSFSFLGNRKEQQDSIYLNDEYGVYAICDGVGGSVDGAKASNYIIDYIKSYVCELSNVQSAEQLKVAIFNAHNYLVSQVEQFDKDSSMATTLVIVIIQSDHAFIGHVGDSRAYHFPCQGKNWVSKDHSVVQELFDAGIIKSEESMSQHPLKNQITNALSAKNKDSFEIDVEVIALNNTSSTFLICSDGAIENFTNKSLFEHFGNTDITLKSRWKLFKHNASQSNDNSSAILARLKR